MTGPSRSSSAAVPESRPAISPAAAAYRRDDVSGVSGSASAVLPEPGSGMVT